MTRLNKSAPLHDGKFNSFGYGESFGHDIKPNVPFMPDWAHG